MAEANPNLVVLNSRAITSLFTVIRDKSTTHKEYVRKTDRLMKILAEEGLANLMGATEKVVETPCGPYTGWAAPDPETVCGVSIVRSGDILLEALRCVADGMAVGKILIQRDEEDPQKRAKLFYSKLPGDVASRLIILCDPMLATGGSAILAIDVLLKAGVPEERIMFLNVVSAPEGLKALRHVAPSWILRAACTLRLCMCGALCRRERESTYAV